LILPDHDSSPLEKGRGQVELYFISAGTLFVIARKTPSLTPNLAGTLSTGRKSEFQIRENAGAETDLREMAPRQAAMFPVDEMGAKRKK